MEIGILGPLEVTEAGHVVPVGGSKRRALLTMLTLNVGNVVTADALVEELWGDAQPREVANALQTQVSQLRKVLPAGAVVARPPGYILDVDPSSIDAVRFERLVVTGRKQLADGDMSDASATLRDALALWRGPALVDSPDLEMARAEAARLEELRQSAFEARVDADLAMGRHAEVISDLQAAVDDQPFRETLRAQLMLALYRSGRQAEALAEYQNARRRFADELGLDPGPELQQLEAAILRQDPTLHPPPRSPAGRDAPVDTGRVPARLPVSLTTFVGREDALAEIGDCVESHRLVTVTGPGGTGKTRTVLEFGARAQVGDGVWFVDLIVVSDPQDVAAAVGRVFGVEPDEVVSHLSTRGPLIILDNCEHVLPGAAAFVTTLLSAAPNVRVLATSREPLNVGGEVQLPLPPLSIEDAVKLFEDRAVSVNPAFHSDLDLVADVCERLDGLPLAIELAAARTKALPVGDIAARLDNRFSLLRTGSRSAAPRHQTLKALVDWSYDLLFDEQRALFEQLSVFPGGIALDAAEAVTEAIGLDRAETIDLIGALVDKSLLVRDGETSPARYRMLETLREYAHERLTAKGELDRARQRQADWCLSLAEHGYRVLNGPTMAAWLDRLVDVELDNARAAMAWALETSNASLAVRLATAYGRPMWERGHQKEGRAWLAAALDLPDARTLTTFQQVQAWMWLSSISSDHDRPLARLAAERGLAVAVEGDDADLIAGAHVMLAQAKIDDGDLEGVDELLAGAAPVLTDWQRGWCDEVACYAALRRGDVDDAESAALRALETYDRLQNPWSRGRIHNRLAFVAEARRDYAAAAAHYVTSIDLVRPLAVHEIEAVRLGHLGRVTALAGDTDAGASMCEDADETLRWLAGSDTTRPMARRRSDLALARGELNDVLVWYEAIGDTGGAAYVRDRLVLLRELIGD